MRRPSTLDAAYFEGLYRADDDPWDFGSSAYERAKYARTLEALGEEPFARALEVGCSIGVLTARLAERCGSLEATDLSPTALKAAEHRCAGLKNVAFTLAPFPIFVPKGPFDLILLSEVLYYFEHRDLERFAGEVRRAAAPGARVLLVHWTGETDYPLSADDAVQGFLQALCPPVTVAGWDRTPDYRLDLLRLA